MIWDYWLLILIVEFITTAGATWSLKAVIPTRRFFLVALLAGLLLPSLIVGIPLMLMNLPNSGCGEGMLFAACAVWALLSLPICLGASITVLVFSRKSGVS